MVSTIPVFRNRDRRKLNQTYKHTNKSELMPEKINKEISTNRKLNNFNQTSYPLFGSTKPHLFIHLIVGLYYTYQATKDSILFHTFSHNNRRQMTMKQKYKTKQQIARDYREKTINMKVPGIREKV